MFRAICTLMLLVPMSITYPVSAQPACPDSTHFVFTPQNPSPDETIQLLLLNYGFTGGSLVVREIDGPVIDMSAAIGSGGGFGVPQIPWTEFGPLPAGDYQVRVATRITNNGFFCPVVTLPLRVGAGAPPPAVAAPVSSLPMLVLLILALGGVGWVALRRG